MEIVQMPFYKMPSATLQTTQAIKKCMHFLYAYQMYAYMIREMKWLYFYYKFNKMYPVVNLSAIH